MYMYVSEFHFSYHLEKPHREYFVIKETFLLATQRKLEALFTGGHLNSGSMFSAVSYIFYHCLGQVDYLLCVC